MPVYKLWFQELRAQCTYISGPNVECIVSVCWVYITTHYLSLTLDYSVGIPHAIPHIVAGSMSMYCADVLTSRGGESEKINIIPLYIMFLHVKKNLCADCIYYCQLFCS